ncbi:MAG: group 1 glycosyl transferase [Gemmatimonadetes bacterium]|nr:group 1 glycosyl transferase [Gemmatimonadota bacterium]
MTGVLPGRPVRVLMLCTSFPPTRPVVGGAERQAEKLALELIGRGCGVQMLAPLEDPAWPARETVDGLTVHRFPVSDLARVLPRGAGVPNTLLRRMQTRRAVQARRAEFDLLHCHLAAPLCAFAAGAAAQLGKPVVCKVGCGGPLFDLLTTAATSLAGPAVVRGMVRSVHRWVAISDEIGGQLREWKVPAARITRIPNGVERVEVGPLPPGGVARRFLFLARFAENRDPVTLVRAFERLLAAVPDCELALVGRGPLEGEVRRAVEAMPDGGARVRFAGYSSPQPWLEWADAVVQPSLAEGMSNTLLEALVAGRACVATDIPPNRALLDGGRLGLLAAPGNADAMAGAMRRLATEPGLAASLASRARAEVEPRYGIGRVADQYLEMYAALGRAFAPRAHAR